MRLVVAGGGTGGHLFPGIAVAEEFLAWENGNEVLFIGTEKGIEARVLPRLGFRLECIAAAGIRGKGLLSRIKGVAMLLSGFAQAWRIMSKFRPDSVLGVGGYASGPVVLAAATMGIRRFIHEQNAIPGFTNKVLARYVERIFISLAESGRFFPGEKVVLTGNPIRKGILAEVLNSSITSAPSDVPFPARGAGGDFRLLVFGGSAGAHSINQALVAALPFLASYRERLVITHQTGEKDLAEVREAYQKEGFAAQVLPFIDNMAEAYGRADLVVCRAGATTIAEVTACGKPCIFIPYPYAVDDHQRRNAEALLAHGAGFMILDRELSGEGLARLISELVDDPTLVGETGRKAKSLARLDAAHMIVAEILK
ncbi:MAG TPA: undecaprenyldiphospho-muramoylpentapeptide beta-N-acetylglucosaminyltransferase [Geobacteraceae bacterium]|nr:undecaprenyldiphospho-muramoylpentapeptide beta-N-acetylglucosaminyltransferase [Geobacteraceae bacterium]